MTINQANIKLKNKYPNEDLSFMRYEQMKKPCIVICNTCKKEYFFTRAENTFTKKIHFCSNCNSTEEWKVTKQKFLNWIENQDDFILIDNLNNIHNSQSHIRCKCVKCGLIQENKRAYDYFSGKKCFCTTKSTKKPKEMLQKELNNKFILLEEYRNTDIPSLVQNVKCRHIFKSRIASLLKDEYYCPICHASKGERRISQYLDDKNISYVKEFKIQIDNSDYRTDFYIPLLNLIIEYNGIQHYQPVEHFGGEEKFTNQQIRDQKINNYCKDNNYSLLIISYLDYDNIEIILERMM